MTTKQEIVENWLPRYTGMPLEEFGRYIILVNFNKYVKMFSKMYGAKIYGKDKSMQCCTAKKITIINFGMGSPNAATIMDLLTAIRPKAVLFLGKCGGLRPDKNKIGDLILPIAGIRGEGTSNDYMLPEVPALPAFALQKAVSSTINRNFNLDYWTGTVYSTNRRVWEHDDDFKDYLNDIQALAIDMETATIFTVAFHNDIPAGALLLVSDMPTTPEGVKTDKGDKVTTSKFAKIHLQIAIDSLKQLINKGMTVKHLKF